MIFPTELEKLRTALLFLSEYALHDGAGWYTYDRALEACEACAEPQREALLTLLKITNDHQWGRG